MLLTLKFLYKNSYMRLHRLLYNQKRRKNHIFFYNYQHNRSNMISHTHCYNHSLHYQYIFRHRPLHTSYSMYLDNFDSMYFDN